ncbi:hypothetical protein [Cohnella sp.]|uniref:hypothetical protein n=1 Tax=Cohnella sp. TaxID=1883426 RepID=UPI003567F503
MEAGARGGLVNGIGETRFAPESGCWRISDFWNTRAIKSKPIFANRGYPARAYRACGVTLFP